ncbi:MAG: GNAT family N-acetyltransferase [Chloroflexota bacterium]
MMEIRRNGYIVGSDKERLSAEAIHEMLKNESYWARSRSLEQVKKSIETSLCFGLYHEDRQVGFARIVTDYTTMFYLCDVIITEKYRSKGLGRMLMEAVFSADEIKGLLGLLMTRSAHGLYRKYCFQGCEACKERFMLLGAMSSVSRK